MNYLQEINSFNDWLIINPSVTSDDIALWYALMNLNNISGWQQEFTVAISTIIDRTRLSRSAIYRSRNRLVQMGRMITRERPGNQCSVYQLIPFTVSHMGTHNGTQYGTQYGTQAGTQPGTIIQTKGKETKLNIHDGETPSGVKEVTPYWERLVEKWFAFYQLHYTRKPSFNSKTGKCLKTIVTLLKKNSEAEGFQWTEPRAVETFGDFLTKAMAHSAWLKQNFLLGNLLSHYDAIINSSNDGRNSESKPGGKSAGAKVTGAELNQAFAKRYGKAG